MEDRAVMRAALIVIQVLVLILAAYKLLTAFRSLRAVRGENATLAAAIRSHKGIRAEIILVFAMAVLVGAELISSNPVILAVSCVIAFLGLAAFIAYRDH